jgi:hypothetical protein
MRRTVGWFGRGLIGVGAVLIIINIALYFMGLSASYNIGDASKFQFFLVSFWHIGAALLAIGALAISIANRI